MSPSSQALSRAEIIRLAYERSGEPQSTFADRFGVDQPALSRILAGKRQAPIELFMGCLHELGLLRQEEMTLETLLAVVTQKLADEARMPIRRAVYELDRGLV